MQEIPLLRKLKRIAIFFLLIKTNSVLQTWCYRLKASLLLQLCLKTSKCMPQCMIEMIEKKKLLRFQGESKTLIAYYESARDPG